ncbi:hypothetical protein CROQUDRAFT_101075 [Cronartium quercuum f. sp. fusiforme G11]|uniref:Uncharacterized protein n=1 Tax=Cronartium quercuum f. sp. fusiforme G11 TaxID=708437 RepID=A0A9P6N5M7_9BASI|nr:hypothetical protein CROQUDRAFT_101075 [Cronartium quercuum f. sp. fusiforme G11]
MPHRMIQQRPKPPPKNAEINKFKAASLIIHKALGKEPFKGMSNALIFQNSSLI